MPLRPPERRRRRRFLFVYLSVYVAHVGLLAQIMTPTTTGAATATGKLYSLWGSLYLGDESYFSASLTTHS